MLTSANMAKINLSRKVRLGMIVRAASRGQGMGRLLLSRLECYAAGQGYSPVWVSTGDPAVGFYRRCG